MENQGDSSNGTAPEAATEPEAPPLEGTTKSDVLDKKIENVNDMTEVLDDMIEVANDLLDRVNNMDEIVTSETNNKKTEEPTPSDVLLNEEEDEEEVAMKVIYNKIKYDVKFPLNKTVIQLKNHLQNIIGVPQEMQKVMIKGLAKDERTLKELGVTKGAKIMVVGSKLDDVLSVSFPSQPETSDDKAQASTKEPCCRQKMHRKVLDKGVPDDAMPGIKNIKEGLPQCPISGMLNKHGGKVRLTFKLELDQVWIGTKERTDKIPMNSIKNVISEPIEEHEEYHMMALQLGPTEASRYWIYWVPAQYVDGIKDAILGNWLL